MQDSARALLNLVRRPRRAHYYPWQKGPPQKEYWYTHSPPMHWYRSFGVVIPSAQLQIGPVVSFLICPSVHAQVAAQYVVTPLQVTCPLSAEQLRSTAVQVPGVVQETLGSEPQVAVQVTSKGCPVPPPARKRMWLCGGAPAFPGRPRSAARLTGAALGAWAKQGAVTRAIRQTRIKARFIVGVLLFLLYATDLSLQVLKTR
jgi:hypothetical protein